MKPLVDNISPAIPTQSSGSITPYRPSLMIQDHCYEIKDNLWNDSIYCDSDIRLRSVLFTNTAPALDFNAIDIKVYLLSDAYDNFT